MFDEERMSITCTRCGQTGDPPPPARVAYLGPLKEVVLSGICASCWKEWEGVEVKVINEYRLSFMEPEHREMLKRACAEFLKVAPPA
jgi:Fe-S cluster biosynthesis and repair protein YggX